MALEGRLINMVFATELFDYRTNIASMKDSIPSKIKNPMATEERSTLTESIS